MTLLPFNRLGCLKTEDNAVALVQMANCANFSGESEGLISTDVELSCNRISGPPIWYPG